MNEEEIDKNLNQLYEAYGSGTGVLFGIPPSLKQSVRAIIKLVLENQQNKVEEAIDKFPMNDERLKAGWDNCLSLLKQGLGLGD